MRLRSLMHILEAVKALVHPDAIVVLGSSSLLARDDTLGEAGQPLELSLDADLLLAPGDERAMAVLHEAVGEGSLFHREYGVYADIIRPEIAETLPPGWRGRAVPLQNMPGVRCLSVADLALAKLALGREKDMRLLRALVDRGLLTAEEIRRLFAAWPLDEGRLFRIGRRLHELEQMTSG